ncbi:hypothetical protein BSLA_02f1859 [Burkholderia stabilis]|nr:hypothetical protein BSLA_02f1859 [Burkholderia stabilis]
MIFIPDDREIEEGTSIESIQKLVVPHRRAKDRVVSSSTKVAYWSRVIVQRLKEGAIRHLMLLSGEK